MEVKPGKAGTDSYWSAGMLSDRSEPELLAPVHPSAGSSAGQVVSLHPFVPSRAGREASNAPFVPFRAEDLSSFHPFANVWAGRCASSGPFVEICGDFRRRTAHSSRPAMI